MTVPIAYMSVAGIQVTIWLLSCIVGSPFFLWHIYLYLMYESNNLQPHFLTWGFYTFVGVWSFECMYTIKYKGCWLPVHYRLQFCALSCIGDYRHFVQAQVNSCILWDYRKLRCTHSLLTTRFCDVMRFVVFVELADCWCLGFLYSNLPMHLFCAI